MNEGQVERKLTKLEDKLRMGRENKVRGTICGTSVYVTFIGDDIYYGYRIFGGEHCMNRAELVAHVARFSY